MQFTVLPLCLPPPFTPLLFPSLPPSLPPSPQEIHSLGSRDDIEDSSSADPDGVTEASEAKKELVAQSGGEGGGENNQDRTLISLEEQGTVPMVFAGM